eukprot:scaffold69585_cov24-Attheya_sp.AAC.2
MRIATARWSCDKRRVTYGYMEPTPMERSMVTLPRRPTADGRRDAQAAMEIANEVTVVARVDQAWRTSSGWKKEHMKI